MYIHHCRLAGVFHQQLMATSCPSYWCYGTMATKKVLFELQKVKHSHQQLYIFFFFLRYIRSSILKWKTFPNVKVVRRIIAHRL